MWALFLHVARALRRISYPLINDLMQGKTLGMTQTRAYHPRRSVLCVPASNSKALNKLSVLGCDAIIFDLEDAVAPSAKDAARTQLASFFAAVPTDRRERIIRINALDTPWGDADLALALSCKPDAILLPKVEKPQDILTVADFLTENDLDETIRIWAMIETPRGVLNAAMIAESCHTQGARLECFVLGLNDLRRATRIPMEPGRTYLVAYIMQVLLAARAYGLNVIDAVNNDFADLAAFAAECQQGKAMGLDGKMLIHPAQIDAANLVFSPDVQAVQEARAIIEAFADPSAKLQGAVNLNGKMVERLHLEEAEHLLERVRMLENRSVKP
jgi:citrate lyase subunit beta / citryl-CoA lyase